MTTPGGPPSQDANIFGFADEQLSNAPSGETDAPPASTIYDPAMLALSPQYQAKVQQRQNRLDPDTQDEDEITPLHIVSPRIDPSVQVPMGEATLTIPEGEDPERPKPKEKRTSNENVLCCFGVIPLYLSLIAFNMLHIILGIASIYLATSQLQNGFPGIIGLSSRERLMISGRYLSSIVLIVLGSILIVCGIVGLYINIIRHKELSYPTKLADIVYHLVLFLVTIVSVALFCFTVYITISKNQTPVFSTTVWEEFVKTDPIYLCSTQKRLACSGYTLNQCISPNNETRNTFCPGHFCVDFCRITTEDVSVHPICKACRRDPLKSIATLLKCKNLELVESPVRGCKGLLNSDIDAAYDLVFAAVVLCFSWMVVVLMLTIYLFCFY